MNLRDVLSAAGYVIFSPVGNDKQELVLDNYFFNRKAADGIPVPDGTMIFVSLANHGTLLAFGRDQYVEIYNDRDVDTKFQIITLGGLEYNVKFTNQRNKPFTMQDLEQYWVEYGEEDPHAEWNKRVK